MPQPWSFPCSGGVEQDRAEQEAPMSNTRRSLLVTLGWQSWSLVVIVLVIMLTAAAYLLVG